VKKHEGVEKIMRDGCRSYQSSRKYIQIQRLKYIQMQRLASKGLVVRRGLPE
jgi:hypothetical protein